MLIEFSIQNFRSIKEEVTLSLVASSDKSLNNNLIEEDILKKDKLLRSAIISGPNASGKSNVVLAFDSLKKLVLNSHKFQKGTKISYSPFKLDNSYLSKPTKFEIVFIKNNIKYVYGVSFTNEKIIDEYLHYYPKGHKSLIFERKDTYNYKFTVDIGYQKFVSEKTLENVLYLSNSTQLNYKKTAEAFDWFKDTLRIVRATDHPGLIDETVELYNSDKKLKEIILKALFIADVGIMDLSATIEKVPIENISLGNLENYPNIKNAKRDSIIFVQDDKGIQLINMDIKTIHKAINDKGDELKVEFEFEEESEGTKRIFSLIGPWIDALQKGNVLVVDELDTKLHHLLNVFLIDLFHDPDQNKNNAQLIFTSHNTNLLNLDLFRRDQIWFTAKKPKVGSTDLYSLLEFSPRKDKNIQIGYLEGRYGAIPFISGEKVIA